MIRAVGINTKQNNQENNNIFFGNKSKKVKSFCRPEGTTLLVQNVRRKGFCIGFYVQNAELSIDKFLWITSREGLRQVYDVICTHFYW